MAGGKEIRNQIGVLKILRRSPAPWKWLRRVKCVKRRIAWNCGTPYAEKFVMLIAHLAHAHPEYKHPYLYGRREVKRVGYIVVSTDRGLCGGLNANLFQENVKSMKAWHDEGAEIDICAIGPRAAFFSLWRQCDRSVR